jgi:hypothetical protein
MGCQMSEVGDQRSEDRRKVCKKSENRDQRSEDGKMGRWEDQKKGRREVRIRSQRSEIEAKFDPKQKPPL